MKTKAMVGGSREDPQLRLKQRTPSAGAIPAGERRACALEVISAFMQSPITLEVTKEE
jgi:hypothetical protein